MAEPNRPIIIVSGPPGAGKTTLAGELARSFDHAVHLHTDDFWHCIVTGGIAPFEPAAEHQNHVVVDVVAGAAYAYAAGGFTTVVDGVVGPWMLDHYLRRARRQPELPLHYVVLRPAREITWRRASGRTDATALRDETAVLGLWDQLGDLGELEPHVLDTSTQAPAASLRALADGIGSRRFLLDPHV